MVIICRKHPIPVIPTAFLVANHNKEGVLHEFCDKWRFGI